MIGRRSASGVGGISSSAISKARTSRVESGICLSYTALKVLSVTLIGEGGCGACHGGACTGRFTISKSGMSAGMSRGLGDAGGVGGISA